MYNECLPAISIIFYAFLVIAPLWSPINSYILDRCVDLLRYLVCKESYTRSYFNGLISTWSYCKYSPLLHMGS